MAEDKEIVLITGANVGIGLEIAKKLLHDHGNRFYILLGCRRVEKGTAAMQELHAKGHTGCEVLNIENTNADLIQEAVKTVELKFGRLDVLHVNAGIAPDKDKGPLYSHIMSATETNVAGSALVAESFAPLLSKSSNPRVIFMSSGLGSIKTQAEHHFHKDWPAYSASKAALNMLMLWFAQQYPAWKINACCPGFRATNLNNYGETTGNVPGKLEDGALNAVRLTLAGKDGETGTFTQRNDETGEIRTLPW